jgi:hypothetical protein
MHPPRPLPEAIGEGPFSRRAALDAGVTDRRLRASDLVAPFHGVRALATTEPTVASLAAAYQTRMHPDHAFSHSTAAMLLSLPLPSRFTPWPLHISCRAPRRPPQGRGVQGHEVRGELWATDHVVLDLQPDGFFAFPLTAGWLTWLSLARELQLADLVALGDAMLTAGRATVEGLEKAVCQWGGGRGAARARAALPMLVPGAMSRPETLLRLQMIAAGLPVPRVNAPVHDRSGRLVFRPDLSWPEYRVLAEYEGDLHRTSRAKFRSDIDRMEEFADAGWTWLRCTGRDVFGAPDRFLGRLHRRLVERGMPPRRLRSVAAALP